MDWKKNDVFQVRIEDMSDTGAGIGKTDGFIWFVKDAVIGDVVEARVMKTKKPYGFARLIQVLEPSACRVTPRCPSARQCGGCQLQAMSYEEQLRFKENKVRNNLSHIGGLTEIPMEPIEARGAPPLPTRAAKAETIMISGMQTPTPVRAIAPDAGIWPM